MQVSELLVGESARIVAIMGQDRAYRQKLIAMGLIPGTKFVVLRKAPLGDPIEVEVRGVALTLRKNEANILQIEEV